MVIQFLCPNGHRIHCREDRAGKPAKCPRCGVKFRVPELEELEQEAQAGSPAEAEGSIVAQSLPGSPAVEEQIEFLCPNGHKLNGPASLQGRPGQCPECGSRFRIPSYEDLVEEDDESAEADERITLTAGESDSSAGISLVEPEEAESIDEVEEVIDLSGGREILTAEHVDEADLPDQVVATQSLIDLVSKLWRGKADGAVVELVTSDGETIVPDRFLRGLSEGSHGVFAIQEPTGTHTVTAVAWSSIVRVVVRGMDRLPE